MRIKLGTPPPTPDFLSLGGPNGLLPLAHQNRAVPESFGKYFCDMSRKLPRHGNSDRLMSFKERVFKLPISVICTRVVPRHGNNF